MRRQTGKEKDPKYETQGDEIVQGQETKTKKKRIRMYLHDGIIFPLAYFYFRGTIYHMHIGYTQQIEGLHFSNNKKN